MRNLNIPRILPDELGTAYFEHVALGNSLTTAELFSRIRTAKSRSHRPSKAQLIAEVAGLSDQDFVCSHTCKPFYGAFETSIQWCHPHGINERWMTHNPMLLPRRVGDHFCPQCASEDINFWGRSYWRRSHQIAGVFWCSKHEIPLYSVTGGALSIQPHKAIHASNVCTSSPFPASNSIPARYQNLASSILDFRSPILLSDLVSLLKQKMRNERYSCWSRDYGQRFLSDTVFSTCSHQWCHDLFSNFHEKTAGEYFRDIDAIEIRRNDQAVTYALALAVLYDDPDEAASLISSILKSRMHLPNSNEPIPENCELLATTLRT